MSYRNPFGEEKMEKREKLLQEIYDTAFHNEMTYHG